ncbi:hypothetical protein N7492_009484 [Penicillium capsulatum]|uniref:Uncharacterized protein n=1 Tax=Penicillium capsulatum TaxID=69766 RepID=A0A9W9HVE3_9EURO|nr:hypothetical protein N7492_009484 [Penicillium capsulatum]KAJ6106874.1 hypothetical protein N7512_010391 [Penicillium capsulatum]
MRHILLHPQLRAALPKSVQTDLRNRVWARFKSQVPRPSQRHEPATPESKDLSHQTRSSTPTTHAPRTSVRKGPPERILVYYGGTGRAMFLGMLRVTTILLFGAACLIVAPSCYMEDNSWYIVPLVIAGGAVPMVFVAYTSAPYVNFVHLTIPAFARRSREAALQYAKELPPTAILHLNTMRFNTIPRQTAVRLGDLVADKQALRPFYTAETSQRGRDSSAFYPELWQHIYPKIQTQKR